MKHLIAAFVVLTHTVISQASLLPAGSPRPIENAKIALTETTGVYQNTTEASLTRVRFEQTAKQGFTLELKDGLKFRQIVFNVIAITEGECGETLYHAISPTNAPGRPTMIVTDHRKDHCDYWTKIADWHVQMNSGDRKPSSLSGEGEAAAIFTPMSLDNN